MRIRRLPRIREIRATLNRLWVRLAVAFLIAVVIAVSVNALIGIIIGMRETARIYGEDVWEREMTYQFTQPNGVIDSLRQYYRQRSSWDGIDSTMHIIQSFNLPTPMISLSYSFMNADGEVLYDSHPDNIDDWRNVAFDTTFPIEVDGAVRGYLRSIYLNQFPDFAVGESYDEYFMLYIKDWLRNKSWVVVVIGITAGALFGLIFSRSLSAPLRRLARAAQAVGSRDLSRRVEVKGSTEVKQLAQAFNDMAQKLEHAEKLRRNLVADIAHELRTPITVLQGNLRAMLDDVYPMSKEEVAALYDQTRLLSRLINDLHEVAQAEARELPMNMKHVNLAQPIRHVVATFEPILDEDGIHLRVKLPDVLPVYGDPTRLSQVFHNLLSNAAYHTPAGGVISISAWREADWVGIAVRDTGKGIPEEHLPFIFERFYRVDRSRSRNRGGMGLGLAISKAIVEAHDGKIWAESQGIPGSGSTFTVLLPVDQNPGDSAAQQIQTSEIAVLVS